MKEWWESRGKDYKLFWKIYQWKIRLIWNLLSNYCVPGNTLKSFMYINPVVIIFLIPNLWGRYCYSHFYDDKGKMSPPPVHTVYIVMELRFKWRDIMPLVWIGNWKEKRRKIFYWGRGVEELFLRTMLSWSIFLSLTRRIYCRKRRMKKQDREED